MITPQGHHKEWISILIRYLQDNLLYVNLLNRSPLEVLQEFLIFPTNTEASLKPRGRRADCLLSHYSDVIFRLRLRLRLRQSLFNIIYTSTISGLHEFLRNTNNTIVLIHK